MAIINFNVSAYNARLISQIAERAVEKGLTEDLTSVRMDITATHANGMPLRLKALAEADDFGFTHDVCGIMRHIDRTTGKLAGQFVPRFARS